MLKTLLNKSDLSRHFTLEDGTNWDEKKLKSFYHRNILGDHEGTTVRTGNQNPLSTHRDRWCHGETVAPYFNDIRDACLKVSVS